MKFSLEGRCIITLEHKEGEQTSTRVNTNFNLDVSQNIERSVFIDSEDMPTTAGVKALTQCFVQGLIGNIHSASQKSQWGKKEHLEYVIKELERGFILSANVTESEFPDLKK